jgi:hypothetical protein
MLLACAVALLAVPAASAKEFEPGDLRVCGPQRCVAIVERGAVAQLGPFYFSGPTLAKRSRPANGVPYYELRFEDGYATGIVATRRLDRFLSYGVHLERFRRNVWYRVPPALAADLRALAAKLRPYRLTNAAVAKSR